MSDRRNWGLIRSGATFEALVQTLVRFEDGKAVSFDRPGQDAGQDVRSGDGTRVFQAKFHQADLASIAIKDAKHEAQKVANYRSPGDPRHVHWEGVTHWRLVTNATFNPTDQQKWATDVVPLFAAQGLVADYWGRADLDALLDKHPEVDRSFFGSETRAFLTLAEVSETLAIDERFVQRDRLTSFFGRDAEFNAVRSFLASGQLFLVVHGAGGIGKTRFLVEAGHQVAAGGEWQVLWANVASMTAASTWFRGILAERSTLLLVDEPEDDTLLRILAEQLSNRVGRTSRWKVAVAVRSPKDPVLRFLRRPEMQSGCVELPIGPLPNTAAEAVCNDLLISGPLGSQPEDWRREAAHEVAVRFSRHPIWLTLAVHVLETSGDLTKIPQNAQALADWYLDEIVGLQQLARREEVFSLLCWIALLGTVNREDHGEINHLRMGSRLPNERRVRELLKSLVDRRALVQRGSGNRLVELKPDVMRDRILLRWLAEDVGHGAAPIQPSDDARDLIHEVRNAVVKGNLSSLGRRILIALARTEMLLRLSDQPVPLLDPLFSGIHRALPTIPASARISLAQTLLDIALVRPLDVVSLSSSLRSRAVATETIASTFGDHQISQDDVVWELSWLVFHAAIGAREKSERLHVLEELCAIVKCEAEIAARRPERVSNDGARAAHLIGRTLGGGPEFWGDFEEAAAELAVRLLDRVGEEPSDRGEHAVLNALLVPAASPEREQIWSEGYSIHVQRHVVLPSQPAWVTRTTILTRIKILLADGTVPIATRLVLWHVLAETHRSANRCGGAVNSELHQEVIDDLEWALAVLRDRAIDLQEFTAARELWQWHHSYDEDPASKYLSAQLEALYMSNDLASEFDPLFANDHWDERDRLTAEKSAELAMVGSAEQIGEFVDRAVRFLGDDRRIFELFEIAWRIGRQAPMRDAVRLFVTTTLGEPVSLAREQFAIQVAAGWVMELRKTGQPDEVLDVVTNLVDRCRGDQLKTQLVQRLYARSSVPDLSELNEAEHEYLLSLEPLFLRELKAPEFIGAIAWTLRFAWPQTRTIIERILDGVPSNQISAAVSQLVDGAYRTTKIGDPDKTPAGFVPWLLDQVLRLPDLSIRGESLRWQIDEILRRVGRARLDWLPKALQCRSEMEGRAGDKFHAYSHQVRLSRFVVPIVPAHARDPDVIQAVNEIVELALADGTVGYYLPEVLVDIDPAGLVVPNEVAGRIQGANDRDCRRLARIAGAYGIGDMAWRTLARPVIIRAKTSADPRALFADLIPHGPISWSSAPGEVPQHFVQKAQSARNLLELETDSVFRPFWEWYLALAEAELRHEEGAAKEERGE